MRNLQLWNLRRSLFSPPAEPSTHRRNQCSGSEDCRVAEVGRAPPSKLLCLCGNSAPLCSWQAESVRHRSRAAESAFLTDADSSRGFPLSSGDDMWVWERKWRWTNQKWLPWYVGEQTTSRSASLQPRNQTRFHWNVLHENTSSSWNKLCLWLCQNRFYFA